MTASAEIVFQVPFHDVDLMGVVWHGHYYKYFELARTELFRRHHCDAEDLLALGLVIPVIESQCRYIAPLTYGMKVRAVATLVEKEFRLKVKYLLSEEPNGRKLARGTTVQAVVRRSDNRLQLPAPPEITGLFPSVP